MGFPGVISYNPTCRGPITPFITGVWAHLGLLITIPSSKMPSFSLPLLSGIPQWVRTSTWTPRKRLAPTRRCQKCLVHGGCFCWCEGNSSVGESGRRRSRIHGDPGRDLFRQKRTGTHHGNSDAWGIFEWSSIPENHPNHPRYPRNHILGENWWPWLRWKCWDWCCDVFFHVNDLQTKGISFFGGLVVWTTF